MNAITPRAFIASAHQQRYFDELLNGVSSIILRAVAGSGKTTTIIQGLKVLPESASVLMLAFNSPIAKELGERIQALRQETGRAFARVQARTFHSLGFGAVRKYLENRGMPGEIKTDGSKLRKLLDEKLGDDEVALYSTFCAKLTSLAKGEGIGVLVPDTDDAWFGLIAHHDLYLDSEDASEDRAIEIARNLLKLSNQRALAGIIDFDDQLYLPLLWKLRLWQNDFVFVDEAQDTNPVRRALAKLALRPGGRLIAVGDERQAIYGFTGASADAMQLIQKEFNAKSLDLTVSYRCPKAVGELVKARVPYFEVAPGAIQGETAHLDINEAVKKMGPKDAILCRNVAPLVSLAYALIGRGIACKMVGSEMGDGLVTLIKKMKAQGLPALMAKLDEWRDREVAKFTAKGEEGKAAGVSDRHACLLAVIDNLAETERTVPALIRHIEQMFAEDRRDILSLMSIHKSKGREYPNVFVLAPELSPSRWARQEHQMAEEENLQYVRDTRAMVGLYFLSGELR